MEDQVLSWSPVPGRRPCDLEETTYPGTGVGSRGPTKEVQRHLKEGQPLAAVWIEMLSLTHGLHYCSPVEALASSFPYPQNIPVNLPRDNGKCELSTRDTLVFLRFPNQVLHRLCIFGNHSLWLA